MGAIITGVRPIGHTPPSRRSEIGCVYHHTSGVELRFPKDFQGDVIFADDKRKAVLIRGVETPFFCSYAF